MFRGCENVKSLDVSGFDTRKVDNISGVFAGCKSLNELDLSSWDLGSVIYGGELFNNCDKLNLIKTPINLEINEALPTTFVLQDDAGCLHKV